MTAPRFELSGAMAPSGPPGPGNPSNPPVLILTYNANDTFVPQTYLDQGYTRFDVIAIGGGGGGGGYIDDTINTTAAGGYDAGPMKNPGGAGGGGGIQYVKRGLLAALPASVPVVVGAGGTKGTNAANNVAVATNGSDGGSSSFNGSTCQASGGKGGKKPTVGSGTAFPNGTQIGSDGGDGGIGGTTVAGGGGIGGKALKNYGNTPSTTIAQVAATPGSWNPATGIGSGGGGGAGGGSLLGAQGATTAQIASSDGAGGAFSATDLSVYSPGSTAGQDDHHTVNATVIIPGYGGGAKAALITGLSTTYGDSQVSNKPTSGGALNPVTTYGYDPANPGGAQSGKAGVVVVRLTAD